MKAMASPVAMASRWTPERTPMLGSRAVAHFDLEGHVALVTGANHGIGAATACLLAASGARVLLSYLRVTDAPDPGIRRPIGRTAPVTRGRF